MTEYVKDIQNQVSNEENAVNNEDENTESKIVKNKTRKEFVREMMKDSKTCSRKNKEQLLVGFLGNNNK